MSDLEQRERELREQEAKQIDSCELRARLDGTDVDAVMIAMQELAYRKDVSATPRLLELLCTTENPWVRNSAAMALSDMKEPDAFNPIVELLQSEHTVGNRGTLLYSLDGYDCSGILPMLVGFVIEGGYEVRCEAMCRIEEIETTVDQQTWDNLIVRIKQALESAVDDHRAILEYVLELFEESESDDLTD